MWSDSSYYYSQLFWNPFTLRFLLNACLLSLPLFDCLFILSVLRLKPHEVPTLFGEKVASAAVIFKSLSLRHHVNSRDTSTCPDPAA